MSEQTIEQTLEPARTEPLVKGDSHSNVIVEANPLDKVSESLTKDASGNPLVAADDSKIVQSLKLDDFEKFINPHTVEPSKDQRDPVKEVKDVEEKSEQKVADTDTNKEIVQPEKAIVKDANARDFTGLPEGVVPHFKRMGNEAFNSLKPYVLNRLEQIKKLEEENTNLKKGQATIPENYYEHPEAVRLLPEYKKIEQTVSLAESVYEHWKQQFIKIESGEEWEDLSRNEKGEIIVIKGQKATVQAKLAVQENMREVSEEYKKYTGKLEQLQGGFKTRYQEAVNTIQEAEQAYFGIYADEKSPVAPMIKQIKEKLPEVFRNHPIAGLLAKSLVANLQQKQLIDSMKAESGKKESIRADVSKAGPNTSNINSSGNGATKKVQMEDFNKWLPQT